MAFSMRAAVAFALVAGSVARLHADAPGSACLPARVVTLYNDRVYIEEVGYLDSDGFRPDVSFTPFFRTLNPAFVTNGTPDEIAAAAGKVLIAKADWLNFLKDRTSGDGARPARLRPSMQTCTIAGVAYVALGAGEPGRADPAAGQTPHDGEGAGATRVQAAPRTVSGFLYWQ
jgi:hypothetical protein